MNAWRTIKNWIAGVFGRYEAATFNPSRSYIPHALQDSKFEVTHAVRETVMTKAQYFELNNAIAQRIGSLWTDYIVGPTGLALIPNSTDPAWNIVAKAYFERTATFIDRSSRQSFGTLQGLIAWRWLYDGEIFIFKTRGPARDGRIFPRIQLIESLRVGTPPDRAKEEGKTIIDGVAIDPFGRPTGYWIKDGSDSKTYRLIDAEDIIHVFEPSRPGQYRGMSFFHAVINDLHQLDDLEILEMKAAADAAEKSTIIESITGELNTRELARRAAGMSAPAAAGGSNTEERTEYVRKIIGGRTLVTRPGEKVSQHVSARPSEAVRWLWDYLTTKVCIGIGVPKQLVIPYPISGGGGAIVRGDYDVANSFFRSRSAVIAAACREVYIYVIGWGIRTEAALADRPGDGSWVNVTIRPPRAVNVDIGRNSQAMLNELAQGATNYELIYSPLGLDWREEFRKLKEQQDYAREIGLELNESAILKSVAAAQPKPEEETASA